MRERFSSSESPGQNARRIALQKAEDVAQRLSRGIVVGADTIVVIGKKILGKPRNKKDARRMLSMLSGQWHTVYTGLALVEAGVGRSSSDVVKTRVRFRDLSADEIRGYVSSGSPLDKAGAYGIQDDYGAAFVEEIRGCFYNVVGFPLSRFLMGLSTFTGEPVGRLVSRRPR